MGNLLPSEGKSFPDAPWEGRRSRVWRVRWIPIFVFLLIYGLLFVSTVQVGQVLLARHFDRVVKSGVKTGVAEPFDVAESTWVRYGGVRVFASPVVLALLSRGALPETNRVLVMVSIPLVSPLMFTIASFYLLLAATTLFLYERRRARRENARLEAALAEREQSAQRADQIEAELSDVRRRLAEREEAELPGDEFRALQEERHSLQEKLAALAQREAELRARAGQADSLEEERGALEELLDEALRDMARKDEEIQTLESRLQRAAKSSASSGATPRKRDIDLIARRLRTLYKNLEIDDRAIQDLVNLRDEGYKLRAEEVLKRLAEDPEGTIVRRKVAGLPAHLTIFELGFGGKGRIYYTRGRQRPFRVLTVGAKNTQKTDLEYLSRLPKEP